VAEVADLNTFDACVAEERHRGRVLTDRTAAERAGVRGTPTFVFRGRVAAVAGAPEVLRRWRDEVGRDPAAER
jgi:predicted DsbA family dithiol-disulfide isomerase